MTRDPLPIDEVLPALTAVLAAGPKAVLEAPPGAGKTTRVPLALLDAPWLAGRKLLLLEPRRLAARAAARRMAATLGEEPGGTVGWRMRMDSRIGPATRIEVVTEGVLTRMLQTDPELPGVGAVLFDEFHERSLQADLGLALCLETQAALRDDLRLLVMSATLDGAAVATLLGGAPVIASAGRAFPVETRWLDRPAAARFEDWVAQAVRRALAEADGDVLVFLPGTAEIRRVRERLEGLPPAALVMPLYGDLSADEQDRAIRASPDGRRKVVLATAIAETSLTIEGVRVVVDGGLSRVPRFEPVSGMTRLETVRVSKASADQRRGRAGRLGPGVCYRLWSEAGHGALAAFSTPEILEADLAPLALDLAQWGVAEPGALAWLDPPPPAAFAQARALLAELGALDGAGRITAHGRSMAALPLHPRLAHMVLTGHALGHGGLACELAALLSERDVIRARPGGRDCDLRSRVELLHDRRGSANESGVDRGALRLAAEAARRWRKRLRTGPAADDLRPAGLLLALAYPDRIGRRRPGGGNQYHLANGRGAVLAEGEALAAEEFLVAAHLDGARRDARVFLAAPLDRADIDQHFDDRITTTDAVWWEAREQAVLARRRRRLGELVLDDKPLADPDGAAVIAALLQGIRQLGLAALPWADGQRGWRERVAFLRRIDPQTWPDVSDEALLAGLEEWLAPHLTGMSRRAHLARLDLQAGLDGLLGWENRRALDELAPTHLTVPTGSRIRVDYGPETPVLAVRLQEMFGCATTPTVSGGRVPVLLHLLSPAQRPLQVTRDLAGFWASSYHAVKKDMKGQYPKHHWPDDPLQAEPTRRAKPRGQ